MSGAAAPEGTGGDQSPECSACGQLSATYKGRKVRERVAHPEVFHQVEDARLAACPKPRWDPEEVALMVAFEKSHPGMRAINAVIKRDVLPHRFSEAITGKRRSVDYRALLDAGAISKDLSPDSAPMGEELPGAPPRPQPPSSTPAFDTKMQGDEEPLA